MRIIFMKAYKKYCIFFYMCILFAGTLFFIPAIFVSRFTTAPALWMQMGISIGIIGYILLRKDKISLPPLKFILLLAIWVIYHIWHNNGNTEKITTLITLVGTFFLFYAIWGQLREKKVLFILFSLLAIVLSLWGLAQFSGLSSSYNTSFAITGPFDNPAGISASLVVLLPFLLYCCRFFEKKHRLFAIISTCLVIAVIVLSNARTAILATVIILILFMIRLLKEWNIKISSIHYTAVFIGCLLFITGLFFMKKDSSNGRLLIWQCSAQLISRNPILGYGGNGFTANYMNEQASYFAKHPDSKYAMIADNVRHPFNEFLKWTVNYGIVGLILTILLIVIPLWISWKNNTIELFFIRLSFLSIGICALFSYPLKYPFIQLMATISLIAFMSANNNLKGLKIDIKYFQAFSIIFSLILIIITSLNSLHEFEWYQIKNKSLNGQTVQMLPKYRALYTHLGYKDLFLYNYAAELNIIGHYNKSQQIALKCSNLLADYDLHILIANNYIYLEQYSDAQKHLEKASRMCPVKFVPLYLLTEVFLQNKQKKKALVLAQKIVEKEVKIPSQLITEIKEQMQNLLTNDINPSLELNDSIN